MKDIRSICLSDTVQFHHKFITAPSKMEEIEVTTAGKNVMKALLTKHVQLNQTEKRALKHLHDIFTNAVKANNQSQQQTNKTNLNIPNTPPIKPINEPALHPRVQLHYRPKDHYLQGCIKTSPHIYPNQQLNSDRHCCQHNPPESDKSHGHAIPVAARQKTTTATSIFVVPRQNKSSQLLNRTTKHHSQQGNETKIHDIANTNNYNTPRVSIKN